MPKDEKYNRGTSREVDNEWSTGESIDALNGRLYH